MFHGLRIRPERPGHTIEWFANSRFTAIESPTPAERATDTRANYQIQATIDKPRTITNVYSDHCLNVPNGDEGDGVPIQQFNCVADHDNRKSYTKYAGLGEMRRATARENPVAHSIFQIIAAHSGKNLGVERRGTERRVQRQQEQAAWRALGSTDMPGALTRHRRRLTGRMEE
jgi:hypothetical protein